VRVTPYALDRSFHIHLPEEAANSVTLRPNYGQKFVPAYRRNQVFTLKCG